MSFKGGCQCGKVAFAVEGEMKKVMECNCSICRPKGYLHWFVPEQAFTLTDGVEALGAYTFNKHVLRHCFCTNCGVSPFVEGPGTVAVNARCLEGVDLDALLVEKYDGKHA